jgi:pyruvate dehydrogenase E1 component
VAEGAPRAQLFGSGTLLREALRAQGLLAEHYGVAADVWSATSYKELRREALECERWNRLHPGEEQRVPYVTRVLEGHDGPVVAVTDYMKLVPDQVSRWVPNGLTPLGTDGFGRSETRESLRRFFEIDAELITLATLVRLAGDGKIDKDVPARAIQELGIDADKPNPLTS